MSEVLSVIVALIDALLEPDEKAKIKKLKAARVKAMKARDKRMGRDE